MQEREERERAKAKEMAIGTANNMGPKREPSYLIAQTIN